MKIRAVTCTSPVNIAVIKYWGKRDEALILPVNSSLSGTLAQDDLKTTTSIAQSESFHADRLWLNGVEEDIKNPRLQACLREMRKRARAVSDAKRGIEWTAEQVASLPVHIVSRNNFPTAAGLASSASGYACLVFALAQLFNVEGDVSDVARMGSGSACRSLYGGFVKWNMGVQADGRDSRAIQVAPETHWPDMRVLVLVVSDKKKAVSSTSGMRTTVETSSLMKHRVTVVPERMDAMEKAIAARDFRAFAELTMKDSNQFHAVCLDTYPPISYMNDVSRRVVHILTRYNALHADGPRVAYTFDAGPNAVLYLLKQHRAEVLALIEHYFPSSKADFVRASAGSTVEVGVVPPELLSSAAGMPARECDALNYVLSTRLGPGPQVVHGHDVCLVDHASGLPK